MTNRDAKVPGRGGIGTKKPADRIRSLSVCIPVWNRADLLQPCFESLLAQLDGVEASIWIFDNGSRPETLRVLERLQSDAHRVFKVLFPENMGIPYVVNCFCHLAVESCDYVGHRAPEFVMLADADAYFKEPIREMIEILESRNDLAIVSGHDSEEHQALCTYELAVDGRTITLKVKDNERGLCLLLRPDELQACYPFPHYRNRDVDWELAKWNRNSIAARSRKLIAIDFTVHLGLYESTWEERGVPASDEEIGEINELLRKLGLMTPERRARTEKYLGARAASSQQAT